MNPYNVDTTESNLLGPITSLNILYDEMPETSGCEKCPEINKDDEIWCCLTQNPSMYYVEFLNAWQHIQEEWSKLDRKNLILRAIRNYLDNSLSKGCIFYDSECLIYKQRPYACRMYGIIPTETWNTRWESLKKRQGDNFEAKPQCELVICDSEITPDQEDKWFSHTTTCEKRIGVAEPIIKLHDHAGGSYRTFHDHILIEMFKDDFLHMLSQVRLENPKKEDITEIINQIDLLLDRDE